MEKEIKTPPDNDEPEAGQSTSAPRDNRKTWNLGRLLWGIILLFIGILFLLDNFNVIEIDTANLWRLWPLLIVAAGISILSVRSTWGVAIVSLLVIASLGIFIAGATGVIESGANTKITQKSLDIRQSNDGIERISVDISANAGQLKVDSAAMSDTVRARLESNFARLSHTSVTQGSTQNVTISADTNSRQQRGWWHDDYRNKLTVTLSEALPLSVAIDSNASQVIADLSGTELEELSLKSGASEARIKLGSRATQTEVVIDSGMSAVTLMLPEDTGISAQIKSGMSSKELPGMRKVSENYYESDNYDSAKNKIDIQSDFGMASFKIEYY